MIVLLNSNIGKRFSYSGLSAYLEMAQYSPVGQHYINYY